jgi:hypothetical protein
MVGGSPRPPRTRWWPWGAGGGRRSTPTQAPVPAPSPTPGGAPWPSFTNPWSGRISMWTFQGQGGGPHPPLQSTAMLTGAPLYTPTWTPPPQPSQSSTCRGVGSSHSQSFSTMELTPTVSTEWITDSGASYHNTPHTGILFSLTPPPSPFLSFFYHGR